MSESTELIKKYDTDTNRAQTVIKSLQEAMETYNRIITNGGEVRETKPNLHHSHHNQNISSSNLSSSISTTTTNNVSPVLGATQLSYFHNML